MRPIAAKAIILLLAIIIAVVLVAPEVSLVPAVSRTDWSACLLLVFFMGWLAAIFGRIAIVRASIPNRPRDLRLLSSLVCDPSASLPCLGLSTLRC